MVPYLEARVLSGETFAHNMVGQFLRLCKSLREYILDGVLMV